MFRSTTTLENSTGNGLSETEYSPSTSSPEDSPVRTLARQVAELVSTIKTGRLPEADSGLNTLGSLAKLGPDGSWQRMYGDSCQYLLPGLTEGGLELYSETWPTWGIVQDGVVTGLATLAHPTEERGSLLWHTPRANENGEPSEGFVKRNGDRGAHCFSGLTDQVRTVSNWPTPTVADTFTGNLKSSQQKPGSMHSVNLSQCVNWPTPSVCGNYNRKGASKTSGDGLATVVTRSRTPEYPYTSKIDIGIAYCDRCGKQSIEVVMEWENSYSLCPHCGGGGGNMTYLTLENILTNTMPEIVHKLWPTPREFMYKDSIVDRNKGNIGEKVGGQLNPDWVEQLMNYPEGWTDLEVDAPRPWQGWPALLGQEQYPYEYPRTTTGCKNRAKRLKALGNSVVPQQAYPIFKAIMEVEA